MTTFILFMLLRHSPWEVSFTAHGIRYICPQAWIDIWIYFDHLNAGGSFEREISAPLINLVVPLRGLQTLAPVI